MIIEAEALGWRWNTGGELGLFGGIEHSQEGAVLVSREISHLVF